MGVTVCQTCRQRLGVVASGGVRSLRFRPVTKTKRCGCTRCVYFYIPPLATPHVVCWCFMSTGWKVAFGMPYLSTRWRNGPNFVFVRGQNLKPPLKAVSWAGLGSSLASFGFSRASATCQSACKWGGLSCVQISRVLLIAVVGRTMQLLQWHQNHPSTLLVLIKPHF